MEQGDFHNWIHIAKEDDAVWPFFVSFTEDLLEDSTSRLFDEYCRLVMDRLVPFCRETMLHRTNTSADGYEYALFRFLLSDEFDLICSTMLPTKKIQSIKAAWTIAGQVLGHILSKWMIDAVQNKQRTLNPKKSGYKVVQQ